jgi:hypothetical protein
MLDLLKPWLNADGTPRLVAADSYFASVPAVRELKKHKIHFVGVIKTATTIKCLPIEEITSIL